VSFGIRFKFSRDISLQYIAHLDMLRLFERTIRRARLPVSYTLGFNPRMKMVFGLPMATGLSSGAEYADVEMETPLVPEFFIEVMNRCIPRGLKVIEAVPSDGSDNVMSRIGAARYRVVFHSDDATGPDEMEALLQAMLDAENVPVMKKGKKGRHEVNVRPLIFSASIAPLGREWLLEAFISAGSVDNLRPDLLMEAWQSYVSRTFTIGSLYRDALYASLENEWVSPTDPRICFAQPRKEQLGENG
jgi:radical SAM-linked protein